MKALEDKILSEGRVLDGDVLKVDGFINQRIDVKFMNEIGKEFLKLFGDEHITKILTVEASGIGIACITAQYFDVPVVFAKKGKAKNLIADEVYSAPVASYTHGNVNDVFVDRRYIDSSDRVLIVDDFLALGNALLGLIDLAKQAGASVAGCGIVIEKAYQEGGKLLRDKGIRVESLAKIKSMKNGKIEFC